MKSKKVTIGMTATLLYLVFFGVILAQGYEMEDFELRCSIERNEAPSYSQRGPSVNKETNAKLSSEASIEDLENAYYYQMIDDKYIDGQMEFINLSKTGSCDEPCTQINNCHSCNC
jgi:hypothetical protein